MFFLFVGLQNEWRKESKENILQEICTFKETGVINKKYQQKKKKLHGQTNALYSVGLRTPMLAMEQVVGGN